jgi:hypothetical protein
MRVPASSPARLLVPTVAALALLSACDGCDEPLATVAPVIEVHDPFEGDAPICDTLNFRDCSFDFGQVPIGQGRFFRFLIKNPSPVDLFIYDITMSDDSDPALKVHGEIPELVAAQLGEEGVEVTVRFVPTVSAQVSGTIIIDSDGANLDPDEKVEIQITGTGVDLGRPELVINPPQCDFGDVGVGTTGFCDLTLENVGERDLEINGVSFSAETPTEVFGSSTILPIPAFIAPGTGLSLRLYAEPNRPETFTGTLVLNTTDPENTEAFVPLTVTGAQAPTAVAKIDTVNGVPSAGALTQVQPLDDVVVTGVDSTSSTPGGTIVSYVWEIVSKPLESSVTLSTPNSMTTGFEFESGFTTVSGIDVAGEFVVRLTVTDDNGLTSTNDARVTLNAVPSEALHIQLTWDSPENDIDLHVKKQPGNYCDGTLSCYYVNCREDDFSRPEFDNVGDSSTPGDPVLDIDDLDGFGPENINIDIPASGTYNVGVHMYTFDEITFATIKIFVNGALREELLQEFTADDQHWEVAEVEWNAGAAVVTPVGTIVGGGICGN